jgi:hypothetical protein
LGTFIKKGAWYFWGGNENHKKKLHYFPILQPGHFRAYSTENDTFDAKS